MMRAGIWMAAALTVSAAGIAFAEEKQETPAEAQGAPAAADAKAAAETKGDEAKETQEQTPQSAASETAPDETPASKAAEPAPSHAEQPEPRKAQAARTAVPGPFQSSWQEASDDEKALFLEAFGESSKAVQERWDKATPEQRHRILQANPLIGARALKHRWASATPEERAAFLDATPRTAQKVKEAWESATPEQRKILALEHPYFARRALHHGWLQATPQEKIAFLAAHPALNAELRARWAGASGSQKQWYAKNYPGLESGSWAELTTEQRALFVEANPAIAEKAREAWQKMQPEARAAAVRRWQGWPLRAYQARLETPGKTLTVAKARPATAPSKAPAKSAKK